MSRITACFRHSALTYEPVQLSNREIWAVAQQVRNQLLDSTLDRQIDLSAIEDKAARFEVNGSHTPASRASHGSRRCRA